MINKRTLSLAILATCISAPLFAADGINYKSLESVSNNILCESEQRCEETVISQERSNQALFVVDGTTLPPDAMRDADQQRPMISASLYVKKNGDVATLPSKEEIALAENQADQAEAERRKVLPVKLFPAPEITPQVEKVVISVD